MTDKIKDISKAKKKKPVKVMIKNNMFELFIPSKPGMITPIDKLKLQFSGLKMFKIIKFIKSITESVECKAYMEQREQIVKAFTEKQEKLPDKKKRPPLIGNMPELEELMNADSGLKIEKHKINMGLMPEWKDPERMFNGHDIDALSCFFEYEE